MVYSVSQNHIHWIEIRYLYGCQCNEYTNSTICLP